MTLDSFHTAGYCYLVYTSQGSPYDFFDLVVHKERAQHDFTLFFGLSNLKGIHGSYKALISNKKTVHDLMAEVQGLWHGDRVGSGKECS
ncbi:hypothetical protein K492DRAFT_41429 [Lichtheimia hyalospora FSU 10163]|nr:hypothetical protein K492DRAFT_41429 [Lichtheimia hyalospora FSU 10163]